MVQYLNTAIIDRLGGTSAESDVEEAIQRLENQLDNDPDVSTNFEFNASNYQYATDPAAGSVSEQEYVRQILREVANNVGVVDGDAWIFADGAEAYGYGLGGVREVVNGKTLYGARVLHTPSQTFVPDPRETFYNLAMHEMSHNFAAEHEDGGYELNSGVASNVSPMATAYTYVDNRFFDLWDTCAPGADAPPSDFNCGPSNRAGNRWCGGRDCTDTCKHQTVMTNCAKRVIDSNAPR